jgi:hypothetical protein
MFMNRLKVGAAVLLAAAVLTVSSGTQVGPTTVGTAAGSDRGKKIYWTDSGKGDVVQVRITGPVGMKVCVLTPAGPGRPAPIEVPGRLNLEQGTLVRFKLADIPNRPGVELFPTVEIPMVDKATEPFVSSSAIPIEFTDEDLNQVTNGALVTKVVYLKTGTKGRQGKPEAIASYNLEPGRDIIVEARRRGAILAVVRMGNIDLELAEPERAKRESSEEQKVLTPSKGPENRPREAEQVRGVVTVISRDGLVKFTLPHAGIQLGDELHAFRLQPQPKYLGRIRVIAVRGQEAVGRVVKNLGQIRIGDLVASELPQASGEETPKQRVARKSSEEQKVLTPEEAIQQRANEKITVQFKVRSIEVTPLEGLSIEGYAEGPHIRLKDGGKFSVLLMGPATGQIRRLGIDPVKHFSGKTVRVTGRALPEPQNGKGPPFQISVNDLNHFEVVKE